MLDESRILVELDNSKHIDFRGGHSAKRAHWLVAEKELRATEAVTAGRYVGKMGSEGLRAIVEGLRRCEQGMPHRFQRLVVEKLKFMLQDLDESVPKKSE